MAPRRFALASNRAWRSHSMRHAVSALFGETNRAWALDRQSLYVA